MARELGLEQSVSQHYARGALEQTIVDALAASGKDLARLTPEDLGPVDEFHVGGRPATIEFAKALAYAPGLKLLDIGSGLGGPSRYFAREWGCKVNGIDLTDDYVQAAGSLAERVGLGGKVSYVCGSALDLPFGDQSFDGAYMMHVGMNISDKAKLFAEVHRVLKPGAKFGIYDVMRENEDAALSFPVPWASGPETSFVEPPARYLELLEGAGFSILSHTSRHDRAMQFFQQMRDRAAAAGGVPPPLGLHILMGPTAPQKVANMIDNISRGLIAPVEIIGERRA
jgi:ubiquinone/menaquinone biosynthesis C-methylase UbiE